MDQIGLPGLEKKKVMSEMKMEGQFFKNPNISQ